MENMKQTVDRLDIYKMGKIFNWWAEKPRKGASDQTMQLNSHSTQTQRRRTHKEKPITHTICCSGAWMSIVCCIGRVWLSPADLAVCAGRPVE